MWVESLRNIFWIIIVLFSRTESHGFANCPRNFRNWLFILFSMLWVIFLCPIDTWSFLVACFLIPTLESFKYLSIINILRIIFLTPFYCDTLCCHNRLLPPGNFLFLGLFFKCIPFLTLRFNFRPYCIFEEWSSRRVQLFLRVLLIINSLYNTF